MNKTLFTMNHYGSVTINIKQYMDEKKITRNALARAINTHFEVVDKWYNRHVEKIDADVLARICQCIRLHPRRHYCVFS